MLAAVVLHNFFFFLIALFYCEFGQVLLERDENEASGNCFWCNAVEPVTCTTCGRGGLQVMDPAVGKSLCFIWESRGILCVCV